MLSLDHIAVVGETLEEAVSYVEGVLNVPMLPGGQHEVFGTHNQLLGLAPQLYLEAISIDPTAAKPSRPRWFGMDKFAGPARLDKWICRVDDLDATLRALPMAGERVDLERGNLRWSMAVPKTGDLPFDGLFPALIQWHSDVPPGKSLPGEFVKLLKLEVVHPKAAMLQGTIGSYLNSDVVEFQLGLAPALRAQIDVAGQTVWLV